MESSFTTAQNVWLFDKAIKAQLAPSTRGSREEWESILHQFNTDFGDVKPPSLNTFVRHFQELRQLGLEGEFSSEKPKDARRLSKAYAQYTLAFPEDPISSSIIAPATDATPQKAPKVRKEKVATEPKVGKAAAKKAVAAAEQQESAEERSSQMEAVAMRMFGAAAVPTEDIDEVKKTLNTASLERREATKQRHLEKEQEKEEKLRQKAAAQEEKLAQKAEERAAKLAAKAAAKAPKAAAPSPSGRTKRAVAAVVIDDDEEAPATAAVPKKSRASKTDAFNDQIVQLQGTITALERRVAVLEAGFTSNLDRKSSNRRNQQD